MRSNARNPREVWTGRYPWCNFCCQPMPPHKLVAIAGSTAAPTRLSLMPHDSIADATLPARRIFAGTLIAFRPIERGCLGARL